MNQRILAIVSIAAVVVIAIGAVIYVRFAPQKQIERASKAPIVASAAIGQKAPEFIAATTDGPFNLAAATKPVFLEIFATWCPHCQRETSVINALYQKYKTAVQFVAVSGSDTGMDGTSPSSQLDVVTFQERFNVRYPVAYDPTLTVAGLYLKGGFPTIAIIDKNKTISYLNSGEVQIPELEREIRKTLR